MFAPRVTAAITAVALVLLCAVAIAYAVHVPSVVPASAPATQFSAERAMQHVQGLARPPFQVASLRNNAAREYVEQQLRAMGIAPVLQTTTGVGTRYAVAGPVTNVLARIPGKHAGGPAVLLMAHYDAVPASPGAGDDGSGTAALLETLRALRASPPLDHDVIALFTDHEEAGLLGAAAFVREHPWARDAAVVMNFEARGTHGPSMMFETGPGNLDAVRLLRRVSGVRATSLSTAVYRQLPNDTDLSELALLGRPALNFAFIGGVERYHTAEDDALHLDPRSVQHHGNEALALARLFGNGDLPRPVTGDGVFFDLPLVGVVVYPESWAVGFALIALGLAALLIVRARGTATHLTRGIVAGVIATVLAAIACAICAVLLAMVLTSLHGRSAHGGRPEWSGVYAAAIALLCVAISAAIYGAARRLGHARAVLAGIVLAWALVAALVTLVMPGASFVFTWPAIVIAAGVVLGERWPASRSGPMWLGTTVAIFITVPLVYIMACIALGLTAMGAAVLGAFSALLTMLMAPHLETLNVGRPRMWRVPLVALGAAVALFAIGALTVRTTARHPGAADLVYAVDADSNTAWLTGVASGASSRAALMDVLRVAGKGRSRSAPVPAWLGRRFSDESIVQVPVVRPAPPSSEIVSDATTGGLRRVWLRVRPGVSRMAVALSADPGLVQNATVDGKPIDTQRYRARSARWNLDYVTPPDSGFSVTFTIPAGAHGVLTLRGISSGIPPVPELRLPRRPEHILPIQSGDVTWVFTRVPL